MNKSANLYRLQVLDTKIDELTRRISALEKQLSDESSILKLKDKIAKEKNSAYQLDQKLKDATFATTTLRIKIEQSESSLYGGSISNPKELQDLQKEITSLKKQLTLAEEQELELMLNTETQQLLLAKLDNEFNTEFSKKQGLNNALKQELGVNIKELEKVQIERGATEKSLQAVDLSAYNRLRAAKSGIAVTDVAESACSACGAEISQAEWQKARISPDLIFCQGCGRIIYSK